MVVSRHPDLEESLGEKYHRYNQLMANNFQTWDTGPNFDAKQPQNVTAIHGKMTQLVCRVFNLGNKTVSTYFKSLKLSSFSVTLHVVRILRKIC